MNIEDIKTLTIVGSEVIINGVCNTIKLSLEDGIEAVQYHKWHRMLEEPLMKEVEFEKYQEFIDEWQKVEDIKNTIKAHTKEEIEAQRVAEAKRLKQEALDNIIVEVNNKVFDGNETARLNMTNAIMASGIVGLIETEWKLANNDVVTVTLDELNEALVKSIQEVGRIVKGE